MDISKLPGTSSSSAPIPDQSRSKIVYIDHLKVLLTALVVVHHASVTYGAPGGWYYSEKTMNAGAAIPMTMFVAINQAFFMGFFFFLSALFIPASYNKKGAAVFIKDRLVRLGVPLLFYAAILSPVMDYLVYYYAGEHHITFIQFLSGYDNYLSVGVMWFVLALLLFTFLYVVSRNFQKETSVIRQLPAAGKILLFALLLGLISFLVRIVFPVGWVLKPLGFQLGHFPQYIALFILGLIASNSGWLDQIDYSSYKKFLFISIGMIVLGFPLIYAVKIILDSPLEWFSGGLHIQAVLYAFWEQITGLSIIVTLMCYGKQFWNKSSVFLGKLSRYAFAVYMFHPLVLISLSLALRNITIDPAMKFLIVAPAGVILSFLLGFITVQIPGVKKFI